MRNLSRPLCFLGLLATLGGCARVRALAEGSASSPSEAGEGTAAAPAPAAQSPAPAVAIPAAAAAGIAFPGAEGFGARAKGGRGGAVCHVKTLAHEGAGSLQACFDLNGPRTVVFDVSGVIQGPLEIKHGRLTIAGQTSPGGVIVKGGVVCDNVYDPNDCNDIIVRHMRFRGGDPDSFRIGGAHDVIMDHCSFATAEDENIELTRSSNVTIQHSVIAEPRGEHYQWGGVLINYSKTQMPLQGITIHHSVWNGVAGRLPEISCEDNTDGDGGRTGKTNCSGHSLSIEIANNVMFDAFDPVWFNRCTGTNQGNDCPANAAQNFSVKMNLIGNVLVRRSSGDADAPFIVQDVFTPGAGSQVFASENTLLRGAAPMTANEPNRKSTARAKHAFPAVTYTAAPSTALMSTLSRTAGAFPRDRMDERLASYLTRSVDTRPASWRNSNGVEVGDAFIAHAPEAATPDTDGDGMSDAWEKAHGMNPSASDGSTFGKAKGCAAQYSALECYINELADSRSSGR